MYALNARDGSVVWTYHAAGAVKASPTLKNGIALLRRLLRARPGDLEQTGRRLWVSGSEGALLGSGTFYSTAAVVYGRVFLGNTDGRIYAYDASTGRLDWAVQTGAYVYASPAVTNAPGLGPTIYLGSYDGTFYALNARSGQIAWQYNAHGRISGSATIVGRTVYFADLGDRRTYGLGISTGRRRLRNGHRLLRSGDQRRRKHLPDRLHRPVRARARGSAGWPQPRPPSTRASRLRVIATTRGSGAGGASGEAWGTGESPYSQPSVPVANTSAPERARYSVVSRHRAANRRWLVLGLARHAGCAGAHQQRARRRGRRALVELVADDARDARRGGHATCRRTATTAAGAGDGGPRVVAVDRRPGLAPPAG